MNFAIKSQAITSKDRAYLNSTIDEVIKEICFYKIASLLEIGPSYQKIFGFDVLLLDDSIEFAMEMCECNIGEIKGMEKDLMQGMKTMHSLKIVHRDIKDKNVSWSPTFKKWVFLDFGFATFLKQEIGEKSVTNFIGTYSWASPELQKLSLLKTVGWVDFYYNDLQALQKVISVFKQHSLEEQGSESESSRVEDWTKINIFKQAGESQENPLDFRTWCSFFRVKHSLFVFKA